MHLKYCFFLILLPFFAAAQHYELQSIHETQTFYLNNQTRDAIGTGDNETCLQVNLPPLTKEWMYSFSASQAERDGSLDLFAQAAGLIERTGVAELVVNAITVAEGNARCDAYLTDHSNAQAFEQDQEFYYWTEGTRENYTQGVVKVTEITQGTVYLCFSNPNAWDGVTINVEVIALVADKTEEQAQQEEAIEDLATAIGGLVSAVQEHKAEKESQQKLENEWQNYWQTGWLMFEAGQYREALKYTRKAQAMAPHPGLDFNLGIIQWTMDSAQTSTESYLAGLNRLYDLDSKEEAEYVLTSALENMDKTKGRLNEWPIPEVAQKLLAAKLEEVRAMESWRRKQ